MTKKNRLILIAFAYLIVGIFFLFQTTYFKTINILREHKLKDIYAVAMDPETATERANSYKSDHSRFIAHAGGELDGHRYTNSLEALDHSYRNGYRLFELDFIKTSDNHFVTSHDWILWRTQTGYEDSIPPTLAEFKKQKILGKYTGISMHDLNLWFVEHPDAILVSDKINEPKKFTAQFIAPDRLWMEFTSWDAVDEANAIGLEHIMISLELLMTIPEEKDKAKYLIDKGAHALVTDRFVNKDLVKDLRNAGIRVYAFLREDTTVREEQTICYESKYFSGIYIDNMNLTKKINCSDYLYFNF